MSLKLDALVAAVDRDGRNRWLERPPRAKAR